MQQNWKRKLAAVFAAGALIVCSSMAAAAADQSGTVNLYLPTGNKPEIQYESGSAFLTFDGVVPGDVLTQNIEIENKRNEVATFYLKALAPSGNSSLLNKLTLEIKQGSRIIYKGDLTGAATSAYGTMGSTNGVKLGQWKAKASDGVTAVITLPKELDNAVIAESLSIRWQIRAEIKDTDKDDTSDSRTTTGTNQLDTDSRGGTGGRVGDNTTTITEEDVPLTDELYNLPGQQTPTTSLPKTGGSGGLVMEWFALLSLAGAAAIKF